MEAYNKLLALWLMSDAPGAATCHVKQFRDLEGQVNLDDNELVIDLFRGSLTCSLQEKFEQNPPMKSQPTNQLLPHQLVQGPRQGSPALPSKKPDALGPRPMGLKVMVTTETSFEEGDLDPRDSQTDDLEMVDPDVLDFSQYQPPMDAGQEEVQDDVNKGNGSGVMH
ncbi:hypothetical protein NDA11_000927 [Ustilago hordei]|uniref:Uncharacterized protein n=1 Tax=Ustilago hordei TaxID=120017 RepID=I2FM54_USTHO|nr:hypothetical protein NDA11_000927 [Ustilago hordei]KAJ1587123.1 hypothetical protein NDA15_002236 [Ustilago hordei]KAJ1589804.1 hypothetical protein NDA12_001112 [Ustilago hordei]CCF47997.1 uncharacterized protein UHOR_12471 [Ustilago hordei]